MDIASVKMEMPGKVIENNRLHTWMKSDIERKKNIEIKEKSKTRETLLSKTSGLQKKK